MLGLKLMMFDNGNGTDIRCRFICEWYKAENFVSDSKGLLSEIEKNDPDVVLIDISIYSCINGIEISRMIRSEFKIPVMYKV